MSLIKCITAFVLFTAIPSVNALAAGPSNGGGGKGVVCRDSQNKVLSVELLDLWEAQHLFGQKTEVDSLSLPQKVHEKLYLLIDAFGNSINPVSPPKKLDQTFTFSLAAYAELFLHPNANVKRLRGISLTLTEDSYEQVRPNECHIEQLVIYEDISGQVFIDQDLVDKMDLTNQAALIVHESLYAFLRDQANESNSIRVRRAVGYVFSGKTFLPLSSVLAREYLSCESENKAYHSKIYITFLDQSYSSGRITVDQSFGSPTLGFTSLQGRRLVNFGPVISSIVTKTLCSEDSTLLIDTQDILSPVDFDQQSTISFTCRNHVPEISMSAKKSQTGMTESVPQKMNCSWITSKQ